MQSRAEMLSWEKMLPRDLGSLPLGGRLVRTDPRGMTPSPIAIVGLYPALTRSARFLSKDGPRNVPVEVERFSFQGSKSANELEKKFFGRLKVDPKHVYLIDIYPYYLANAGKGDSGRTMWDNVLAYQGETGQTTAVKCRPLPDEMVKLCRVLDGNKERLEHFFDLCRPSLVITLGNEVAAFARGLDSTREAQKHLYDPTPMKSTSFGQRPVDVVHCAHPGNLMRPTATEWNRKHDEWCMGVGLTLVTRAVRDFDPS